MASTIQLKTGTGSAIPSSLTQGEVGINIDNGLFYYGSGSGASVKPLESFSNITASGDISSSGTITALNIVMSNLVQGRVPVVGTNGRLGSDDDLTFSDDTLTVTKIANVNSTSHVTASGAISSSDFIRGLDYEIEGKTFVDYNSANDRLTYGQNNQNFKARGKTIVIGDDGTQHITASGAISSSGTITANDISLPSTSPSVTTNLLYVSSSISNQSTDNDGNAHITASNINNDLKYNGSTIATETGVIYILHGMYKLTSNHDQKWYISWGDNDRENQTITNSYVSYHPPYDGKIRKVTIASDKNSMNDTLVGFHSGANDTPVYQEIVDVDFQQINYEATWGGLATFKAGDRLHISINSETTTNTSVYWNVVFEFNID